MQHQTPGAGEMRSSDRKGLWSRLHALLFAAAISRDQDEPEQVLEFLGSSAGVFVEVGAYDPVALSQTYRLETLGWRGVLIEPLAEYAELLRRHRRATVYEVAAGAPEDDGRDLMLVQAGALSTLNLSTKHLPVKQMQVRPVRVRTLDSILSEAGIDKVDFISIDVEGTELQVLRGFSLERYRPRLILVEDDLHDLSKHRHLSAANYKLVRRTALNNWYIPREVTFPVSAFGRWQFFRKILGIWPRRLKLARRAKRRDAVHTIRPE